MRGGDKMGGFSGSDMHKGLKNRSPDFLDKSLGIPKSPSVDSGATRGDVAPNGSPVDNNGRTA